LTSVEGTAATQSREMYDRHEVADEILIDSGASSHMSATDEIMINLREILEREILTANMQTLVCNSIGDVDIVLYDEDGKRTTKATMKDVLYVPGLRTNLLSCRALVNAGIDVTFSRNGCTLKDADNVELIGVGHCGPDRLCILSANVAYHEMAAKASSNSVLDLWHERLDHMPKDTIEKMVSEGKAKGITLNDVAEQVDCDDCQVGRATRKPFRGELGHAKNIGDVIHSDLCGEFQRSTGRHKYFVSFIDEMSRSARIACVKKKST
jgi:hypothetical protein